MDELTELALSARHGDTGAATAFVRATQTDVWRLCAHLGSPATAEDLAQETYARAFAGLHRFARTLGRPHLAALDRPPRLRRRRPRRGADALACRCRSTPSPTTPSRSPCSDLLDALDDERREAFVLTQLVGLTYAEAAEVCGCPVGTIRSRVARARADLVAAFGGRHRRAARLG